MLLYYIQECVAFVWCMDVYVCACVWCALDCDELRGGSLTIRNISVLSTCLPASWMTDYRSWLHVESLSLSQQKSPKLLWVNKVQCADLNTLFCQWMNFSPCMLGKLSTSNKLKLKLNFHYLLFWLQPDQSSGKMRSWSFEDKAAPCLKKQAILCEPQYICHCVTSRCSIFADRLASFSTVLCLSDYFTCVIMALPTLIMCSQ